ncbi:hypothetical protein [Vibrio harveyi]|uniref:hypothetical protein n=1 Tax=Vibrio harveyi TaxID=669 RepID=UPI00034A669F|nr:hypothetical protein [Vibrio harveyi]
MMNIYLDVEGEKYFDRTHVNTAVNEAVKVVTKWLTKESIKRLGTKLRIRSTAGRRRVRMSKTKAGKGSVWYGLRPINLAYVRAYSQEKTGVRSGESFYKSAFTRSMNGSRELIWVRSRDRAKVGSRRPRSPNGTRRKRKSPVVEVVREDLHDGTNEIINQLELEAQGIFREAFLDAIHK